jgi:hypothetical protein
LAPTNPVDAGKGQEVGDFLDGLRSELLVKKAAALKSAAE